MPILFDSSMYINALRIGGDAALLLQRWARESPLWLSSVVLEGLYAGATRSDYRILARLTNDALIATSAGRAGITVVTVNQRDFVRLAEFCPFEWQARGVPGS